MPITPALRRTPWQQVTDLQAGVISRGQLLEFGLTPAQVKADMNSRRWQRMLPGVYATFTGPIGTLERVWAAVLYAGPGAAASHATALWLWQLADRPAVIDVVIPESRRVDPQPGLRIHRRRGLNESSAPSLVHLRLVHPSAQPPRLRVEEAVLDMCGSVSAQVALDIVLRATQRRATNAERLRRSMSQRPRQGWRNLLLEVLTDVEDGVASPLERHYRRDIEIPHHLPRGLRNEPEIRPGGHLYRDVRYRAWHVIVELDGREAHPVESAFRDMRRDNLATVIGEASLRYGWRDVAGDPCGVAVQVGAVLQLGGWRGQPQPCGTTCPVRQST